MEPGFDLESRRRIAEAVLWVEGQEEADDQDYAARRQTVGNQPVVNLVQASAITPSGGPGGAYYPGNWELFDPAGGGVTLSTEQIWLSFPNSFVPEIATSYGARLAGSYQGQAVYRVMCGQSDYLNYVQCINNALTLTRPNQNQGAGASLPGGLTGVYGG
jgi:hypothetical protein